MIPAYSNIIQHLIGQALDASINPALQTQSRADYATLAAQAWARDTYDFKVNAFLRTSSPHWLGVMTDIEIGIWRPPA